jgi:hypothetical protein
MVRRALDALRPTLPDPTLRHFTTIPAAATLARSIPTSDDPDAVRAQVEAMLREVEADGNPQIALIAAVHRMLLLSTSTVEVRSLEARLHAVDPEALGAAGWARRWLDIAHLHLIAGAGSAPAVQTADAILTEHAEKALMLDPSCAAALGMCIAHVIHVPSVAERWLSWLPADHAARARARWMLDRPDGDVPFDDPALVALLEAWRDGDPLPVSTSWFHLRRALDRPTTR